MRVLKILRGRFVEFTVIGWVCKKSENRNMRVNRLFLNFSSI